MKPIYHKWQHQHSCTLKTEKYDQYKCTKCGVIKRVVFPFHSKKNMTLLVLPNENTSFASVPKCKLK